jgi:hypothetical protein
MYGRVRNSLKAHVGDVDAAAVPCGFGRAIGNKVRMSIFIVLYRQYKTISFAVRHFFWHC